MKEILEALIDLHVAMLERQKILIGLLEKREILTRAEVDSACSQVPQSEYDADTQKVRDLFQAFLSDRLGWTPKTPSANAT